MVVRVEAYVAGKPLLSTTDWPTIVSCVVFFVGCNLRCRFCFNAPILEFKERYRVNLSKVFTEVEEQKYLIDGVMVTGGEPTLQPQALRELAHWTHQQELLFGLMTNGTKPDVLRQLIVDQLVDYVAVDLKTVPCLKAYAQITQSQENLLPLVKETIKLLKSSEIHYEFRTNLVPNLVNEFQQIDEIAKWVGINHFVLQTFRPTDTLVDDSLQSAAFSPGELEQFREYAKEKGIPTRF